MRTVILLLAVVVVVIIVRYIWRKKGLSTRQIFSKAALYALAAVLLVLMLTGRVHWLVGALGAVLPVIGRLLPLIRYVPLLRGHYRRFAGQSSGPRQSSFAGAQTSSVQSRFLRMQLNLGTGEMDGDILEGRMQGRKLSELQLEQLIDLLREFAGDQDSQALLQTYLDRVHGHWREHAAYSGPGPENAGRARDASAMTVREACEILGVAEDAGKEQIIAAHRRLMQKVHPDRGGSGYLAAKINQAKDFLLKQASR